MHGVFRLDAGNRHLHRYTSSPSLLVKTVARSLRHSCRSDFPDKEFRDLRTVIVTAAIHRGFIRSFTLRLTSPFNLRHRAGVSPYTSFSALQRPVFC